MGDTALMGASRNGHLNVVRTLLEAGALVNAQNKVRNQMMMIVIIVLTIIMMMLMLMMIIVIDVFMLIIDNYDESK